ncbi:hypothetical protein AAHB54_00165, partial [Bacillus cereus]
SADSVRKIWVFNLRGQTKLRVRIYRRNATAFFVRRFSALITNIISNGFYLTTVFPVFFMAILLFIARYIHIPNNKKHEQEA